MRPVRGKPRGTGLRAGLSTRGAGPDEPERPGSAGALAEKMKRFRRQFFAGLLLLLTAGTDALWLHHHFRTLPGYPFLTGWVLLAVMLVLALFNARKKLPFLPLGRAETWLQI